MEEFMKLVHLVNKFRSEKSLKAYSWYQWL
ncbi:tryptorubin family RiPP precursor [Streptomyces sp. NPDC050610]|nr:tryptorubin family RiPP precursor [Streptomyces varsoviensis]